MITDKQLKDMALHFNVSVDYMYTIKDDLETYLKTGKLDKDKY